MRNSRQRDRLSNAFIMLLTIYMSSILAFSFRIEYIKYSQLLFILAFGVCLIYIVRRHAKLVFDPYLKFFGLFILFCAFSILWAEKPKDAYTKVMTLIQLYIMSGLLFMYICHSENIDGILTALFLSGIISCLYIFSVYGYDGYMNMLTSGVRAGADIGNVNDIGTHMAMAAMVGFYFAYSKKKIIAYPFIIPQVIMTLGSGSRKALVLLVVGIVLIVIMDYTGKITPKKILTFAITVVVLIAIFKWVINSGLFDMIFYRFDTMLAKGSQKDSSTIVREEMIRVGWRYFTEHPFSGIGIGNGHIITRRIIGRDTYLHNNFVELLASVGIIGFIFYYTMYVYIIKNLFIIFRRTEDKAIAILMIILFTRCAVDYGTVSYYDKMNYIYLTIGAASIYVNRDKLGGNHGHFIKQVIKGG